MREFDALAQQVAEDEGIAVLALCFPSERHEVCTVYRRGRRPHTFILSGPGEDTPRHFAALGESRVTCPIGDGLEVAGLGGITASHALCSQVGQHTHGDDGA
jgi:hypothetical protein